MENRFIVVGIRIVITPRSITEPEYWVGVAFKTRCLQAANCCCTRAASTWPRARPTGVCWADRTRSRTRSIRRCARRLGMRTRRPTVVTLPTDSRCARTRGEPRVLRFWNPFLCIAISYLFYKKYIYIFVNFMEEKLIRGSVIGEADEKEAIVYSDIGRLWLLLVFIFIYCFICYFVFGCTVLWLLLSTLLFVLQIWKNWTKSVREFPSGSNVEPTCMILWIKLINKCQRCCSSDIKNISCQT